jgi:membrane protein involved in colicin uptake
MGFFADLADDVFDTDIGPTNRRELAKVAQRKAAAAQAAAQKKADLAAAKAQKDFEAFAEAQDKKNRQKSVYDSAMDRKKKLAASRKSEALDKAAAQREAEGKDIAEMNLQRGGTGGLLSGVRRRSESTQRGYGKFGPKRSGLTLALRGLGKGKRPT